jgi:hypothetical protein
MRRPGSGDIGSIRTPEPESSRERRSAVLVKRRDGLRVRLLGPLLPKLAPAAK